jgi:hypothetical protein
MISWISFPRRSTVVMTAISNVSSTEPTVGSSGLRVSCWSQEP